ncbi:hypothetical protein BGZ49_003307, partial [Haplosporangium sp. Z 27]
DLKPDNVLLDEHGHAHLTDFNIAVYFNPAKPLLSIAGSMAYMAPEVLMRKGYLQSVDWWSLGVITFELLFGKRPFRGKTNDLLTNSILRDPLPFPDNALSLVSSNCIDVVSKLCERDISKRLGCTPDGLDAFKKHPWFEGMNWDMLVSKQAIPPFEPDSKRANFDATHELEELLMEDNPLKAKKRAQTSPDTELSAEMQLMEDKFTVYDFTKVKRSTSLNRGRILRPTNDTRMNSGTLDGVVTRNTTGRVDPPPIPTTKIYRPDSPSDRVGQDRYQPDDEYAGLTQSTYKRSPLGSPALNGSTNNSPGSTDSVKYKAEKQEYFELEDQGYQASPKLKSQGLGEMTTSEAIVLPPTSLPRPLQPRDNATGLRVGSPRHYVNSPNSGVSTATTSPTSPNSLAPSPLSSPSSYGTPISAQNSPPTPSPLHKSVQQQQQQQQQQAGNVLFASLDAGMLPPSLNSSTEIDPPFQDSAKTPVSRRPVRGRESAGYAVSSMPASITAPPTNPRLGPSNYGNHNNNSNNNYNNSNNPNNPNNNNNNTSNPRRPLDSAHQYQKPWQSQYTEQISRPMSAYTTSAYSSSSINSDGSFSPPASYRQQPSASSIRSDERNMYRQQQQQQQPGYGNN